MGSSPRVRGTRPRADGLRDLHGIIPARAGNTRSTGTRTTTSRDHPRVCGEHCSAATVSGLPVGSSPHVRGTRQLDADRGVIAGIIPACAGNTRRGRCSRWRAWDHPHVCGEHRFSRRSNVSHMGSSPRVRGTLLMDAESADAPGIIPACAGNTTSRTRPAERAKDHPRVCGEHADHVDQKVIDTGSSPRVRGTRLSLADDSHQPGIIPACAGNTLKNPSSKYHSDRITTTF